MHKASAEVRAGVKTRDDLSCRHVEYIMLGVACWDRPMFQMAARSQE